MTRIPGDEAQHEGYFGAKVVHANGHGELTERNNLSFPKAAISEKEAASPTT